MSQESPSKKKQRSSGDYFLTDEVLSLEEDPEEEESESDVLIIDECIKDKKKESSLPQPPSPVKKNLFAPVEIDDKKFEQVENELEALFAGVESDEGKPVERPAPTEEPKVKAKRPYKRRTEKTSSKVSLKSQAKLSSSAPKRRVKTARLTEQDGLLEKYKGPFLRILGPDPLNPTWSNVINFSGDALSPSGDERRCSMDGISEREHQTRLAGLTYSALFGSSTSAHYDENWICVFCKNRSHYQGLGDLFGPYNVPSEILKESMLVPKKPKAPPSELASKFILGATDAKAKRKRKKPEPEISAAVKAAVVNGEVWMHEDCLCWIGDVRIQGHRVIGLERAIEDSNESRCAICSLNGCSFGCSHLGCRRVVHYPCAVSGKWTLDENEFMGFCLDHSPA